MAAISLLIHVWPGRKLGNLGNIGNLGNFFPRFLNPIFHSGCRAKPKTGK